MRARPPSWSGRRGWLPTRSGRRGWLPTDEDIANFRAAQRLAYVGAEAVAASLEPGVTEREAAGRLRSWLVARGVDDWFHVPFAWFGDRTAFRGFRTPLAFFPTGRRLEEGMAFILDCAPIVGGATADIGYSGALGANPVVAQMVGDLAEHRDLILECVRQGRALRQIYLEVDRLATRQGFDNRHQVYPRRVLAHQVFPLRGGSGGGVVAGFGTRSLQSLVRRSLVAAGQGWSPLWSDARRCDHPPVPGLWAVEPHLGFGDVGVKFEELLVVTPGDAYWLDDDVPHLRGRQQAAGRPPEGVEAPAGADVPRPAGVDVPRPAGVEATARADVPAGPARADDPPALAGEVPAA
ncbi:MAG: M24 family metallopeptidase [Acidimicrobiales bacterium]